MTAAALNGGGLESWKLDLAHRLLIDVRADGLALILLVVEREVLDGRDQSFGLNAEDLGCRELAREPRIFAERLEVPASLRHPHDVDHRREDHVLVPRPPVPRDRPPVLLREIW